MRLRRIVWAVLALLAVAAIAFVSSDGPIDFRVYYLAAKGLVEGSRPVYGIWSGAGWPLHYRYPPMFLLLFYPLTLLPLGISATIWLFGKLLVVAGFVRETWRRLGPSDNWAGIVIPALIAIPYLILDFRYGNVQLFIVALVAVCLFWMDTRPLGAAAAMALAISIKVWPVLFLPYLVALRRYRVAGVTVALTAVFTLAPAIYLGGARTLDLLAEWADQELVTQAGEVTMWFPSQSLQGVLLRYLTEVDYSQVPDGNYPAVNLTDIADDTVRTISIATAALVFALFLWVVYRRAGADGPRVLLLSGALMFSIVALFEPHTQRHALVLLLWPALVAGRLEGRGARRLVVVAAVLAAIQPLLPGSSAQRVFQTVGADFAIVTLLAAAFMLAFVRRPTPPARET